MKNFTKRNQLVPIRDLYHWKPLCSADPTKYSVSSYKNIWVPMHQFEWKQITVQGFLAFQTWIYLVNWPEREVCGFGSHWFQKFFKFLHFCQKNLFITSTIFLMLKLTYFLFWRKLRFKMSMICSLSSICYIPIWLWTFKIL